MSKKRKYSEEYFKKKAVSEVKKNTLTSHTAAKVYKIPKSTIYDHVRDISKTTQRGPARMLLPDEESALIDFMKYVAERGFPITRKKLKTLVLGIVKESGRHIWCNPKNGPGDEWCRKFFKRHPELSERIPVPQDKARARMSTYTVLGHYFELLEKTTKELGIEGKPSQIFNCDESGFSGKEKSKKKVIVLKGHHAYQQNNLANSHITLHLCISAEGRVLPSFVIFEGSMPHRNFTDGVPPEWLFGCSDTGYMDGDLFLKWFKEIFIPNCGSKRPVHLVMDNHDSHITLPFLKLAKSNDICIFGLPPHTTHLLQPLDVGLFGPLKEKVTSLASSVGYLSSSTVVGKAKFPALLSTSIDYICTPARIKSSFRKSGLYPISMDAIDKSQIQPADPKLKEKYVSGDDANPYAGEAIIKQLEEKDRTAQRMEEEKENRKVERIRKREEKERQEEEKRVLMEERKKEREQKKIDKEKEKERKRYVKEKKKARKNNNMTDMCIVCDRVESQEPSRDIIWLQCKSCLGWAHQVCLTIDISVDDDYMCDECVIIFEE